MSLVDFSAGDSWDFSFFSRVGPSLGGECCGLLTRAGLMSFVIFSAGNLRVFVLLEDQALFRVAEFAAKLCVNN